MISKLVKDSQFLAGVDKNNKSGLVHKQTRFYELSFKLADPSKFKQPFFYS